MGELKENIFEIGSPDVDIMTSKNLPTIQQVKERYDIDFNDYAVAMYHPVTTEVDSMEVSVKEYVDALIESGKKYVVIYPNNDLGSSIIIKQYKRLEGNKNFKVFPSLRFEYFLVLLKKSQFIIGNSSAGIREAPYYGIPTINIGSRQNNRVNSGKIINCDSLKENIIEGINKAENLELPPVEIFGKGNSDQLFLNTLSQEEFWEISKQKQFKDFSA